ncbi:uncharacterized protein CIMG_06996 [Coccidioides immitis RS]|uniref:Uncharacterized protein n=1 Tax=Coccidioides immitis (strain RS) TaxID=246410 RepID=J3K9E5_COCIM|nr:uncharacterized protein CIMG_06996 [Coccidioides immitis RS]EAS31517.3 hypothetical protein CIMG_06996 [Coccidioides immitis RS]
MPAQMLSLDRRLIECILHAKCRGFDPVWVSSRHRGFVDNEDAALTSSNRLFYIWISITSTNQNGQRDGRVSSLALRLVEALATVDSRPFRERKAWTTEAPLTSKERLSSPGRRLSREDSLPLSGGSSF